MNRIKNHKRLWIMGVILALVLVARAVAPTVILKKTNEFLANFSPDYSLHIADLDLGVLLMRYRIEGLEAKLKREGDVFLKVEAIDVNVAWRELFRGRVVTDVVVLGAESLITDKVIAAVKNASKPPADDAQAVKDQILPVAIERVEVRDSTVQVAEVPGVPADQRWELSEIQARVSNLTPRREDAETLVTYQATFMNTAALKGVGKLLMKREPMAWDFDTEMRAFDLVAANPVLKRVLPFTFTKGTMDMYAEVKSSGGNIEGYVKPYLKKVDVVGKNDFVGVRHFFIEIAGALGNVILRRSGEHSVATKIPFKTENGVMKVDAAAAIANAIDHGFGDKIAPSLEESISL